jgi:hypothetical protein
MSNAIRAGGDGGLKVTGQSLEQITVYRIEWGWIALPVCVLVGSLVQLILVIFQTRRTRTPIWKTSSLAILSRGSYVSKDLEGVETLTEMEAVARNSAVTLFEDWKPKYSS